MGKILIYEWFTSAKDLHCVKFNKFQRPDSKWGIPTNWPKEINISFHNFLVQKMHLILLYLDCKKVVKYNPNFSDR